MSKSKTKSKAIVAVPQSREEAVQQLGRIGSLRRQIAAGLAAGSELLKAIAEETDATIAPMKEQLAAEEKGLQTWCEANRAALTYDGKVKFADLGTGTIKWRARPAAVTIRGGVEAALEAIKRLGLSQFIRTKEEINKDAMRADPKLACAIAGVTIGAEGEDFEIVPAELDIPERQVA